RIDPEGDRRLVRVDGVDDAAELRAGGERLFDRLAALRVERHHLPRRQADAVRRALVRRRPRRQLQVAALALAAEGHPEPPHLRRVLLPPPLPPQQVATLAHAPLGVLDQGADVDQRDAPLAALEEQLLGLERLADRRAVAERLLRRRHLLRRLE